MRSLGNALASSIGKKVVMGLTGLLLVAFLAEHLYGNLKLVPPFGQADGSAFFEYREALHHFGIYLKVAEVGLFALFLCHAYLAFRLTLENREARRSRYAVRADRGAQTFGSVSMFYTGVLILGFLIKHLVDFRFDEAYQASPTEVIAETLSRPLHGGIYLAGMVVLGIHLSHGFQSALQSVGVSHPRYRKIAVVAGYAVAVGCAAGLALVPIYFLVFWTKGGTS